MPLASAPTLDYLAGYQIGYRLQASGEPNEFQRVAMTVTGVPDGQPTQPCRPRAGYYMGRFAFAGTRFIRAGVDPAPVLLVVQFRGLGFADPRELPICTHT